MALLCKYRKGNINKSSLQSSSWCPVKVSEHDFLQWPKSSEAVSNSKDIALPSKDDILLKPIKCMKWENVETVNFNLWFYLCRNCSSRGFSPLLSVVKGSYDAMAAWSNIRPGMVWKMRWKSSHWGWIKSLMTGKIVAFLPRWPLWRDDQPKARWKVNVILSSSFPDSCHQHWALSPRSKACNYTFIGFRETASFI